MKKMDHVVCLNANGKELDLLLSTEIKMIIQGAAGRKLSNGRVNEGGILYFINNNAEGIILATVKGKPSIIRTR